jgi:Flp pilus assembly protein TadG
MTAHSWTIISNCRKYACAVLTIPLLKPGLLEEWVIMGLKQFLTNTSGNMAVLYAIAAFPMMAAVGCGIDFGSVVYARASANAAADAAVLMAIRTAENAYISDKSNWKTVSEEVALKTFEQNLKAANIVTHDDPKIAVNRKNTTFEATVTYHLKYPTQIMHLFSQDLVEISNVVTAKSGGARFINVDLVIDISASMGIGASVPDQKLMVADAGMGNCAFACHFPTLDTIGRATQIGAKVRLDVAKEAAQAFLGDVKAHFGSSNQVQVSVHVFSNDLKTVRTPTTNVDQAIAAIETIELDREFGKGGTLIENSLGQLVPKLPDHGDGSTPGKRTSFVVVLTDGIEDSTIVLSDPANPGKLLWGNYETAPRYTYRVGSFGSAGSFSLQPPLASACDGLKVGGRNVMMARVKYVRPENERAGDKGLLDYVLGTAQPSLNSIFQSCASQPEYSYLAADSAEIKPVFDEIFKVISRSEPTRLTQ